MNRSLAAAGPLLAAALLGAVQVLAFAPFGWWPLAWLSLAGLFALWLRAAPGRAFRLGYAFGLGLFGFGTSWVYHSIHTFGQSPAPFAAALTVGFVAVLAAFPAAVGWAQARLGRAGVGPGWRLLAVMPALWLLAEWLRGWLFTGFPWLQVGYSQRLALGGYGPLLGVLGMGGVTALLAGLTVWGRRRPLPAVLAAALLLGAGWGLGQVTWTRPEGRPLRVALVQGNIAQGDKWRAEWLVPTVERYLKLTRAHLDSDLVVWPEVALPGRYRLFKPQVLDPLRRELADSHTDLITGILHAQGGRLYNALLRLGKGPPAWYHKRHLVPFGEYIPLRRWLTWLEDMVVLPAADIAPGRRAEPLPAAGTAVGGSICYEDAYGAEMADLLPAARLLVNVSNDAWFGDSLAPHQHLQIARLRALELGRPLLRATNTGISAVIDHRGRLAGRLPQFTTAVLTARVQPRAGRTPFARWRNGAALALAALALVAALTLGRRRPRGVL